ncbi:NADPH-dependent FMN reductase [Natronospira bacteriovora]|uniref:NADPH-dependent FMN reductase n=1 Tax=Natronospira bacteriovora TaxID=3069753 RepID=A0ABU0W8C7_9GAMM|nr:NADPH-dependent FMN reductase [Natronospira sp. AB-CW4]MDQ2070287.1 NADPH-dependent FMN reductase [Natronospira sp. AB-CW4]
MQIVGIAGSLRKGSFNRQLLEAMAALAPEGVTIACHGIEGIPVYDGDVENDSGIPAAVETLKEACSKSDGLLLVTPEYNQSVPGPLKNAMDWMSRPPKDIGKVFRGLPVALTGASAGPNGSRAAQYAWLPVFRGLGLQPWFGGQLYLPRAGEAFDEVGQFSDPDMRDRAQQFVSGFARFVDQNGRQ